MSDRDRLPLDDWGDDLDVSELLLAAGEYVEVTDDLRPRTLEAARARRREISLRKRMGMIGLVICCLAVAVGALRLRAPRDHGRSTIGYPVFLQSSHDLYTIADRTAASDEIRDTNWSLVRAFQDLRRRQSQLIR